MKPLPYEPKRRRADMLAERLRLGARGGREPGDIRFRVGVARAFAGALVFSLPMLMTMEMWWLGFYVDRSRLALLLLGSFPLLVGLSHFIGFEVTFDWREDVVDALVAVAVAFCMSAAVLTIIAVLDPRATPGVTLGTVALQAVPGAIGALLATGQLNGIPRHEKLELWRERRYLRQLFLMLAGALFLSLNLAPTEEMILIAYKMTPWHDIALVAASLLVMHAFASPAWFGRKRTVPLTASRWGLFAKFTVVGYALALLASFYMLWTFGRFEGVPAQQVVEIVVVLAFPAAIGAAAARLVL